MEPRYPYVHVDVTPEMVDETSGLLWELGAEGVEERDAGTLAKNASDGMVTLVAAFASREEAEDAMKELPGSRYEEIVGDAWRDAWKEHYRPFAIAPNVVIRPPWEPYEAKPGEHVLELEPGRAFGTGLHETTRLVARALHDLVGGKLEGVTVLDVGCGSGVLALVARKLGAAKAIAIDVDPEAIEVTLENAARNGIELDASTKDISAIEGTYPVVVANIESRILIPMAPELGKRVAPGGLLLLSGILVPQGDDVRAAYPDFTAVSSPSMGEWMLLALRRG